MKKLAALLVPLFLLFSLAACSPAEKFRRQFGPTVRKAILRRETICRYPRALFGFKGGSFQMGSPESEAWRSDDETQHTVTVSGFYMSKYELTQKEYEEVMGSNPSNFQRRASAGGECLLARRSGLIATPEARGTA